MKKVLWDNDKPRTTTIKVFGVGGGGCNAVASMVDQGFVGVEFYAVNTDYQALERCCIPNRIQIGESLTQGSGAGAVPSVGEKAAREAEAKIREAMQGADMVFITAGLGGGTGTGAAPVVAEIARELGILNVAIVTKPFQFEGTQRMRRANEGIERLRPCVDTVIVVLNDKLMEVVGAKTPLTEAFAVANSVLAQGIRAICDLIATPGLINVDFQDVRTIMGETGGAVMGVGIGKGENRAIEAVRKACHSPLQEKIVIDGARGILINITGPKDISMLEINEATSLIYEMADPEANVIFGVVIDEDMHDALRVTIIATGFGGNEEPAGFRASALSEAPRPRPHSLPIPETSGAQAATAVKPLPTPTESATAPSASAMAKPDAMDETDPMMRPAILSKRERQSPPTPSTKVDFESPENPLNAWERETPKAEPPRASAPPSPTAQAAPPRVFPAPAPTTGTQNPLAPPPPARTPLTVQERETPVQGVLRPPQRSIFSDVATPPPSDIDDDYETPALRRRRRSRLFE